MEDAEGAAIVRIVIGVVHYRYGSRADLLADGRQLARQVLDREHAGHGDAAAVETPLAFEGVEEKGEVGPGLHLDEEEPIGGGVVEPQRGACADDGEGVGAEAVVLLAALV